MPAYWDSTALLNALCALPVAQRLRSGEHVTRSHAFVETFHHLSGRGLLLKDGTRLTVTPSAAARMVRGLAAKLRPHNLDPEQTLTALDDAHSRGVRGGMIHDWMHVRAARIAGADTVLSRDEGLSRLAIAEGLKAEWP
jgi:hypothetical protein